MPFQTHSQIKVPQDICLRFPFRIDPRCLSALRENVAVAQLQESICSGLFPSSSSWLSRVFGLEGCHEPFI